MQNTLFLVDCIPMDLPCCFAENGSNMQVVLDDMPPPNGTGELHSLQKSKRRRKLVQVGGHVQYNLLMVRNNCVPCNTLVSGSNPLLQFLFPFFD